MTATAVDVRPAQGAPGDDPPEPWRGAWVLLGILLVVLAALSAAVFWLGRWSGIDAAGAIESQPPLEYVLRYFDLEFFGNAIGFGAELAVAALVLSRDRTNKFAWLLGGSVVAWMTSNALFLAFALMVDGAPASPSLPMLGWSAVATLMLFPIGLMTAFALFPSGRLAATGLWRRILQGSMLIAIALILGARFAPGPIGTDPSDPVFNLENPFGLGAFSSFTLELGVLGTTLLTVAAVSSIITTYVRSGPVIRHQIKWVVAILVPFAGSNILIARIDAPWEAFPAGASVILVPAAVAVAVTKYRLYDIDIVISKTLVYASLAGFIGVVYVGVVVGVGSLVDSGGEPSVALSVVATALVAVAFQPVRRRLERVANRMVFGRKATPYEVLSDFSRRVATTSDSLLDDVARSLVEGTRADRVSISMAVAGTTVEAAAWPKEANRDRAAPASFPITDGETELGALNLFFATGQVLQDDDRRLAEHLAAGMGLALRNQALTDHLQARVNELRESRRRLVALQDETRRRLERDLHDGAQQQLVALKVKLGLGRVIADKDGAAATAEVLGRLSGEADQAIDALRDFARGVYPPLLEAEGLPSAIAAHARRMPLTVTVHPDGVGRYHRDIESTVYFCVLEALRNAVQHADATEAHVTLAQSNGALAFEVGDNGRGFGPDTARGGGLTSMTDRLDALEGELRIESGEGHGTTLIGSLPVSQQWSTT